MDAHTELEEIIAGCQEGDAESFSRLVDLYSRRCYGYFFRMTGSRAVSDDLLSELFVKLVEKIGTFKGESFDSWLFKVTSNVFHDYLRRKYRDGKVIESRKEELEERIKQEQRRGSRKEDEQMDKLQEKIERLDGQTRELIMLRFYSQLSFKEIAKMRGEPIGTVMSKVHRGVRRLRELMG
jgi:RNA polymerase sigma-70 factor (ECF subfamily)